MSKHTIFDANNLYKAFLKSRKSSPWKEHTQKFEINWLAEISKLQKELETRTYKSGARYGFVLHERGKTRMIHGSNIRDRIVRHSLCDNVLEPVLRPKLIYDNCASVKGRGISLSRKRLKVHLRKYFAKYHTNEGYILLIDFSGYYDNIRHALAMREVAKHLKDEYSIWLLEEIFRNFRIDVSYMSNEEINKLMHSKFSALEYNKVPASLKTGKKFLDKSLDIGDQSSQIIGIYFPTCLDNYIKIVKGMKYYGRYMDDSYIISNDKEELKILLEELLKEADKLGIIINLRKTRICKLSKKFRFLQNSYFLTGTGKVVEQINPKRLTAMRRKLKKIHKKVANGQLECEIVEQMFRSWYGGYYKVMSRRQRFNVQNLYKSLYGK